jgi:Holliday junction resolvase-like predicted endonuclease
MLEREIEDKCATIAAARGVRFDKWRSTARRGDPDRILIGKETVLFVELKSPGKKATAMQIGRHKQINEAYGTQVCYVIDSVDDFKELLDEYGLCAH